MELWIILTLLAAALWALANSLDKFVSCSAKLTVVTRTCLDGQISLVLLGLFIPFVWLSAPELPYQRVGWLVGAGLTLFCFDLTYFSAVRRNPVSTVVLCFQIVPALLLVIGYFLFDEPVSLVGTLGGVLLISTVPFAVRFSSVEKEEQSAGRFVLYLSPVLLASYYLFQKAFLLESFLWAAVYGAILFHVVGGLLYLGFTGSFGRAVAEIRKLEGRASIAIVFSALLNLAAIYLMCVAISMGPIGLVLCVASTQPMFVILFQLAFGLLKADPGRKRVITMGHFACAALQSLGIFLIHR